MNVFKDLIPPVLIALYVIMSYRVSKMGWAKLAEKFKHAGSFVGKRIGLVSISVNVAGYQSSLILKHNEKGIYLKPIILIRLFHPPVFIPWEEIKEVREKKVGFRSLTELIIGDPLVIVLTMKSQTFKKTSFRI